jgi:hypothetical protein
MKQEVQKTKAFKYVFIYLISIWNKVIERYSFFFDTHKPIRVIIPTRKLHFGCLVEIEISAILND